MKIQVLSDLHNEFYRDAVPDITPCGADIIVLAGDIDIGERGLEWAKSQEEKLSTPIIYVPGNHEYYGFDYNFILENKRFVYVRDDVRFICATLWTDYMAYGGKGDEWFNKQRAKEFMADFSRIKIGDIRSQPDDFQYFNMLDIEFIKNSLDESFDGKTVVVTHHGPSIQCQHTMFGHNREGSFFYNDLDFFFNYEDYGIDLWIYGHTHSNLDIMMGETRLVSNQRGYPREYSNDSFDPAKIINLV